MWDETSAREIALQTRIAVLVQDTLNDKEISENCLALIFDDLEKYRGWELGLERFHTQEPLPHDWMDHIPYFIDFRSSIPHSDEDSQRSHAGMSGLLHTIK